jgi:hypothetical protein
MASIKKIYTIAMLVMAMAVLENCSWQKDYTAEIRTVDSLHVTLDSVIKTAQTLSLDSILIAQDSVMSHTTFIQFAFQGEMKKDMAETISHYRYAVSVLNNPEKQYLDMLAACMTSKVQLENLKAALTSKATTDSLGNEINEVYVQQALNAELKGSAMAQKLFNTYQEAYHKSMNAYNENKLPIQTWVDSLRNI